MDLFLYCVHTKIYFSLYSIRVQFATLMQSHRELMKEIRNFKKSQMATFLYNLNTKNIFINIFINILNINNMIHFRLL